MISTTVKTYSFEEYCQFSDDSDNYYEFVDGHLDLMTPPSFRHLLIADKLKEIFTQEIKRQQNSHIYLSKIGIRTG